MSVPERIAVVPENADASPLNATTPAVSSVPAPESVLGSVRSPSSASVPATSSVAFSPSFALSATVNVPASTESVPVSALASPLNSTSPLELTCPAPETVPEYSVSEGSSVATSFSPSSTFCVGDVRSISSPMFTSFAVNTPVAVSKFHVYVVPKPSNVPVVLMKPES